MEEIYKDIPNMKGYQVSNKGNIKSFLSDKKGKIISQSLGNKKEYDYK